MYYYFIKKKNKFINKIKIKRLNFLLNIRIISILFFLFGCKEDNPTEPESITNINGSWMGNTSQDETISFEVDQDKIVEWGITISSGSATQTVNIYSTSVAITNNSFELYGGSPEIIIEGEFKSNSKCTGSFSQSGTNGTWTTSKTTEGLPTGYPRKATIITPEDNSTGAFSNMTLYWECSDPDNDPLTYTIYFGTSNNPPVVQENYQNKYYTIPDLEFLTTYYWKIDATDSEGNTAAGDIWKFTTNDILSWQNVYQGDQGRGVLQTPDQGFIVTGNSSNGAFILKTDSHGNELWYRNYGQNYFSNKIKIANDGGYIVVGYVNQSGDPDNADVWLMKTDVQGNQIWSKNFGYSRIDVGFDVIPLTDGGFTIIGLKEGRSNSNAKYIYMINTDNQGNEIWNNSFGYTFTGYTILSTEDPGYIVAANSLNYIKIFKTDTLGNIEWEKLYDDAEYEQSVNLKQTNDGNYIIIGTSEYGQVYLIKIDADGNELWSNKSWIDANGNDIYSKEDGGYLALCTDNIHSPEKSNIILVNFDPNGEVKIDSVSQLPLVRYFGGTEDEFGYCLSPTQDGGCILVGESHSFTQGNSRVYLLKTSSH